MDIPTRTAYLAEIAPRKRRGAILGPLLNTMWIVGALCSTLIAVPLLSWFGLNAWRWMFGLAAISAILALIGRRSLPESPRWLLAHGRCEEARQAFAAFGIEADDRMLQPTERKGSYADIFGPGYRKRLFWVALIFTLNCFSGSISSIAAPLVLKTVGALSTNATLIFTSIVWVVSHAPRS